MLKREDWIIVYLSLLLFFTQYAWLKAERQAAYYHGRLDGLLFQMTDDDAGQIPKLVHTGAK